MCGRSRYFRENLQSGKQFVSRNNESARAMWIMITAMLLLPGMDAIGKWLAGSISPGQISWSRFFFQLLLLIPFMLHTGKPWLTATLHLHAVRGGLIAAATVLFFTGLIYLPLAEAISIFFIEPMLVTLLSAVFLRERIGIRRLSAIVIGFCGAMIIIRPTFSEVGWAVMYPVGAALCFSFYILLTRKLVLYEEPVRLQFFAGVFGCLIMSAALLAGAFSQFDILTAVYPTTVQWLLLGGLGLIATVGHLLVVYAFRHAPVSVLAPFQYVEIIGATIYGLLLFNDFPDLMTWTGILIIIGSGVYIFHRESRLAQ